MQDHEIRATLEASLRDGQLDRTERDSFRQRLEDAAPNIQKRSVYQSMAFDLVRDALERNTVNLHSALNWLERITKLLTPLTPGAEGASIADVCFSPQHDCASRIVGFFENARTCVDVCVFTITDDRISEAIMRAHRRGVGIRVLTDDDKLFDAGSDIRRLSSAGLTIRIDNSGYHMHHKFAVFDRSVLLNGSYNWTRGAAMYNEENFIVTSDSKLVQPFRQLFDKLWERFGNPASAARSLERGIL